MKKINLLDPQAEPSEAELSSLMDAVLASAMRKREVANAELAKQLVAQTVATKKQQGFSL